MFRAVFGAIKLAVSAVFHVLWLAAKLVYRILAFLHIRLMALYLVVCALLSLFLPVFTDGIVWFWVGFGLCAAVTLIGWVYSAHRAVSAAPRKTPKKEEGSPAQGSPAQVPPAEEREEPAARYPRYFEVEGHPGYFFAEYADRYELYMRGEDGAVYIRTDRKEGSDRRTK